LGTLPGFGKAFNFTSKMCRNEKADAMINQMF
jgi:hypothetical protein